MSSTFFCTRLMPVETRETRKAPKNHARSFLIGPPNEPSNCLTSAWTGLPPVDTQVRFGHAVTGISEGRGNSVLWYVLSSFHASGWNAYPAVPLNWLPPD